MTEQQEASAEPAMTCDTCGNPLHPTGSCDAGCPPVPAADQAQPTAGG